MAVRLEWTVRPLVRGRVASKGEQLADGNAVVHPYALIIGPLVIEGTADQLRELSMQIVGAVIGGVGE